MDTSGGKVDTDKTQSQQQDTSPQYQSVGGKQHPVRQPTMPADQVPADQAPAQPPTAARPAGAKEEEFVSGVGVSERVPIVERREPRELPEEVAGWLERVEHDEIAEPQPIVHEGKTIVAPAAPADVEVTLPLTEEEMKKGLQQKVVDSIRWLAQWCVRLIDKYRGKVWFSKSRE
jgi:hypothetical protein